MGWPKGSRAAKAAPRGAPSQKSAPETVQLGPTPLGPDVLSLIAAGHAADDAKHDAEAQEKLGQYRIGNAGLVTVDATGTVSVHGSCHRVAWSRTVAAKEPERQGPAARAATKALMFGAGHSNEDLWKHDLRTWVESLGGSIKREEEVPVLRTRPNGQVISGRPDMVLLNAKGEAVLGLELKLISSIGTALDVSVDAPKPEHMAQAMSYQMELSDQLQRDVPWQLWYTSRAVFANPGWSFLPQPPPAGEPGSELHEYGKSGKATKFPPGLVGFHLRWHEGRVHWARANGARDGKGVDAAGRGTWRPSDVTVESLDRFWDMAFAVASGELGPRPSGHFNKCDYCGFQPICDQLEATPEAWKRAIEATGRS